MNELAKAMKEEIEILAKKLGVFIKDFDNQYNQSAEKIKSLEADIKNYSDSIASLKIDMERLAKEKEDTISEIIKLKKDCESDLAKKKADFNKIIEGEQKRLQALEDKFEAEKKDYTETAKETTQFNQEAKEKQGEIDKTLSEVKTLKEELIKKNLEADNLIAKTSLLKAQQDTDQKKIIDDQNKIKEGLEGIDLEFKNIVETKNAQTAKDEEQKREDLRLKLKAEQLKAHENKNIKESERLLTEDKRIKEQNALLTTQRSDLKAKEENLNALEREIKKK